MRYAIYQLRKHPGRAHLHVVDGTKMTFDGQPLAGAWVAPAVKLVGNELQPADVSTIFGPSALVVSDHARQLLASVFEVGRYEFLPVDCPGHSFFIVNVLGTVDCLREDKADLSASPKKYDFNPAHFGPSLFKLPQDAAGPIMVLEDQRALESSFKYQFETQRIAGLRFDLVWEGNDKRQLADKKPPAKEAEPELPVPEGLEVVSATATTVALQWRKSVGVDSYAVQWSKYADREFVTVDTVNAVAGDFVTFTETQPTAGTSYYRVFGFVGSPRYRSKPSVAERVELV